jgi:hypothetical protein
MATTEGSMMTEQTQKELLELSKKALTTISMLQKREYSDLVFQLRDVIRKAEQENKNES